MMKNMTPNVSRLAVIALLGLGFAACSRKQAQKPDAAQIAGTWTLAEESFQSVVTRTGKKPANARLELAGDGSLTAADLPVEDPFAKPAYRLVSGKGRWQLQRKQDWMVDLSVDGTAAGSYFVEKDADGKAELVYHVYEPESKERWIWRRAP